MLRKSSVFQRKTDIGEAPKRKKTQTEETQVRESQKVRDLNENV